MLESSRTSESIYQVISENIYMAASVTNEKSMKTHYFVDPSQ